MLTYSDLRKEKKGIVLLSIEAFSVIGLILYEFFFEIHILFTESFLTNIKETNGFLKLFGFIFLFSIVSYFIFYSRILGLFYQIASSFSLGYIFSTLLSGKLLLSITCCAIFTLGFYYIQILRPIQTSKKEYLENREANGITQYKYLGYTPNGQKRMNRLIDRYDSLNNRAMHIFSNMRSSGKIFPEQFSFITKQILSIKKLILIGLEDLCEAEDDDFETLVSNISVSLDELHSDVLSLHSFFNSFLSTSNSKEKQASFSKKHQEEESPPIRNTSNKSFDFFLGCEDATTLKKRYRDLMKAYHSDGISGNEQISVEINTAYEEAKNLLK